MNVFRLSLLLSLASLSAHAWPQPQAEARLQAGAWIGSSDTGTPLAGCFAVSVTGPSLPAMGQSCVVPNAGTAAASNLSYALAPTAFNPSNPGAYQLARLGARADLAVEVLSYGGTRDFNAPRLPLTVYAAAGFRDYLLLGSVRPASLQLDFHLSGELRAGSALAGADSPFQVQSFYSVSTAAGYLSPFDGAFVVPSPRAEGYASVGRRLDTVGGATSITPTVYSASAAGFSHGESANPGGGTDVRITLGADFFANPASDTLLLDINLSSFAYGAAWSFKNLPFGTVFGGVELSADFGSTFEMRGLTALDEHGIDITADAVRGFQSLAPVQAVPEPATWLLWLGGLALWVIRRGAGRR